MTEGTLATITRTLKRAGYVMGVFQMVLGFTFGTGYAASYYDLSLEGNMLLYELLDHHAPGMAIWYGMCLVGALLVYVLLKTR